tara:strand:+ start:187 stop:375 length:189 start_codon:yes stop_codon:yes gene_type:complete
MPDITVSFTDAQWTRIVAASTHIKGVGETGDIDANYLSTRWKKQMGDYVQDYEKSQASVDNF